MARPQLVTQAGLFGVCQRWRSGRASYRPAGECFDPSRASVSLIDEAPAKAFVLQHHYSGSYPAARLRVGLFMKQPFAREQLAGVAVFSVPMTNAAVPRWFEGVAPGAGVELGRFVLLDELQANAETWFQARALRLAARSLAGLQAVLSYCDPVARTDLAGRAVFPGHLGTIYRAGNALALDGPRREPCACCLMGVLPPERALSKLRTDDMGAAYALQLLQRAGAPARLPFESGAGYLQRLSACGFFRSMRHPGNLVFGWRLAGRAA